ncbi:hypothetical protein CDL15_Pgr017428 [Punica granatum]|uniref:Uncharacterized protein n=1 Tax=Punica granatum TaxID=22663 RepID=A0A218WQV2_PUNGR|nr:hypothetical protein CDL15_Pgr017428 [Punica granatum]
MATNNFKREEASMDPREPRRPMATSLEPWDARKESETWLEARVTWLDAQAREEAATPGKELACKGGPGWLLRVSTDALDSQEAVGRGCEELVACKDPSSPENYEEDRESKRKPEKENKGKGRQCLVTWLSGLDHLITGESKGHEEPLESNGTTHHGHGMEKTRLGPRGTKEARFCATLNCGVRGFK